MLPANLEDWLTDQGDRVVRARVAKLPLSTTDQLIHEIWLLDTEARNGGLSQYFLNYGTTQWESCSRAALAGLAFVRGMFPATADKSLVEWIAADMSSAPKEIALAAMVSVFSNSRDIPTAMAERYAGSAEGRSATQANVG